MNKEQEALLYLISLGIGGNVEPYFDFIGVNWRNLINLSYQQGVTAIACDGLHKIYHEGTDFIINIDALERESLKYEWYASIFDIESRNHVVSNRVKELYRIFAKAGIRSCLLKGQGISQLYPFPEHRVSGDIDLWVEEDRDRVLRYIRVIGVEINHVDVKHSDVKFFDDVPVEIHFLPSYSFDPVCWKRIKQLSSTQIHIQALLYDSSVGFAYPSIEFNLVYVLHHIYRHIFIEGVKMRQVTDYACILMHSNVNKNVAVWNTVCLLKMKRFAAGIMWIMKECYHIEDSLLLCQPNEKEGRFLLDIFWSSGTFGQYNSRYKRGYFREGCLQFKRNLLFLMHYPNEVLWSPFWKLWHWCWRIYKGYI